MKRVLIYSGILTLMMFLQTSPLNFLKFFGAKPDFILAAVIAIALFRGDLEGGIYGLVFGLLQDLLYGDILGINALGKFLTGYLAGYCTRILFRENVLIPIIITFLGSIFHEAIILAVLYFLKFDYPPFLFLTRIVVPFALINSIMSIFLYKVFQKTRDAFL
ncbi:MAG: rod shape-determining protein MreD [Firmicutes bacterium]|nr:rod shape-determining protein MreD [Bacillota bacterium]